MSYSGKQWNRVYQRELGGLSPRDRFVRQLILVSSQIAEIHPIRRQNHPPFIHPLHRLERKLPTAVQLDKYSYYIFDEQGATFHASSDLDNRLKQCCAGCWPIATKTSSSHARHSESGPSVHADDATATLEVEPMEDTKRNPITHIGSAVGSRDSHNRVSWLGAHPLDLPVHEGHLQTRARIRTTTRSLPQEQVGTIDSQYRPQHELH